MKIVLLDYATLGSIGELETIKNLGEFTYYEHTSPSQILERIADADVVITNKVKLDRSVLEKNKSLKLISILATGMNNVDLKAAEELGIEVKNVEGYSTNSVTQHTFAVLFQLLHQLRFYDDYVKNGQYANSPIFTHIGYEYWEIKNKTFGIIGLGNIGKQVASVATAFGANVVYYSASGKNNDNQYQRVELDELLNESDIVSIHAPLNKYTQGLLGKEAFEKMKTTAILLNMGRGGIVDEASLANALDEKQLFAAGLDVLEQEPIATDNPLLSINEPNRLLITPHIAWASVESRALLIQKTIQNIRSVS